MKLLTFIIDGRERLGLFNNNKIYDLEISASKIDLKLPSNILELLDGGEELFFKLKNVDEAIKKREIDNDLDEKKIKIIAPVPHPRSCRDGYAFRQHVETARRNRGVDMIPEFDKFPVFYFTNHNAIFGEGDMIVEEDHLNKLDFELEAAIVIGKKGKNIKVEEADSYIFGYTIMNDLSARYLQSEEMKMNLGPAKGKDFATTIGPWLVTQDELGKYLIKSENGNKYNLEMKAFHNGKIISQGNLKDMNWSFAEIIARASYGVELYPGDVIGSGTVGTGCYLELNGTNALIAKTKSEVFHPTWLKEGDIIELEITGLGKLSNKILKSENSIKIFSK